MKFMFGKILLCLGVWGCIASDHMVMAHEPATYWILVLFVSNLFLFLSQDLNRSK